MKRLINRGLSLLMAVLMLLAVFTSAPVTISAADGDPEFVFEKSINHYDGSQFIKLVRYNGTDENIVIPERVPDDYPDETLRGKDFSIIRESAFFGNTNIKTVTIQNNVNHIGGYAFSDCTNLEEVTIGTNLDYLAASSFANCPALEKVTIYSQPNSFTMESGAFVNSPNVTVYGYHGSQVEAAIRGSSIPFKGIDHSYGEPVWSWDLYSSATAKFSCEYGDDTQEVEANIVSEQLHEASDHDKGEKKYTATATFEDKTYTDEKTEYTDPEHNVQFFRMRYPTPESNGHIAYRYCSDCGMYFSGEYGNEDIAENETILPYYSYEYSSDGFYKLIGYNGKDEDITVPAVIPDNYPDEALRGKTPNIIREDAFKNNTTIKTVTILNNISHIGSDAFRDCSQLKEVTIGNNLDYFGYRCFENCTELEKVTIYSKDSRFSMQESSFSGCPNVVVYGYHGTAVEYYMNNYSIPFVSLGHAYGAPVWSWDGYSSATASFTCAKNDDTKTVDATITSEIAWAPSGEESGARQYTATITFEGETYTDTRLKYFDYVASVTHDGNTVNFEDLSTASAAENWVEGSTLTLLTDADVTSSLTVPAGAHTLDLNGHGIRATGNQNFSVITIPADAELTLNDSGSTTHKYSVENSLATVDDSLEGEDIPTFTGGYITGGRGNNGGAVFNSGVFTMNAGTIIGNKVSSRGGGIYNSGTVNLTGGQIIYNVAQQWGAGIYLTDTAANTLNLSGGSITNNLCNNNGGGIQVSINAKVNVLGDPVVKDNFSTNGLKNNINLSDNGIINVTGQLDSAALIGVRRYDGAGVITAGENTDYNTVANFFSDNADYVVGKDMTSGQLKLHAPYTVTWKNYNDDILETDTDLREGDIPTYDGVTPTKPDDEASFYVFDKWSPDVTAVSSDATYTATFTKYDAVAKVGDTLYLTFPEAVNAADGAVITLLSDIDEPYVLAEDQTIRVFHNEHQLTVNAPEGEYRVDTSTEGNAVAYRAAKLYAEVNGNKYESFSEAATVAAGVKNVTLLRDIPSAFSMNDHNSDILRVKANGFEANIIDYVRKENKKGVTYYYKKEADAYVDGDGVDLIDGVLIIGTGAAVVVELGAGGGAGVTVVVGAGAEVLIDGGSDASFEPEDPEEECLEEEEQEDGSKKIKSLKYHWVKIDTGISILDAGAEVLPDCVNDIWETYNQNISTIVKILPPVLDIVGYTDVRLAFPYPEGWFFPPIPYLPEAMNPGSHFIGFFEGTSASSYGTPFLGKEITEDLDITGIWLPYEAAVIKPDGSLDYYLTFSKAAESRDGNIVKILSAPLTDYTLKKIGDNPAVYEVLKVKRGNYIGGSHVNEPSGVPEGYSMRTWTYTDEEDEVVTCYTIDGELTATFVYNNGSPDTTQTVYTNQLVEKPEDPVKPRCFFEGWYADEQLQQPFDFTRPIYNNVTLYAKWNETPGYTVQKVWDTGSNLSLRPDSVKAVLQQNVSTDQQSADWQTIETLTLSDENNWRGTFSTPTDSQKLFRIRELGPDKSDGSQGDVIYVEGDQEYVDPEGDDKRAVVNYSFTLGEYEYNPTYRVECTADQNGNMVITNTLADRVLNIEKKWDIDLENKDRPESVQMVVQANNGAVWENVQLVTLSADNGWKASVNVPSTRSAGGEAEDIEYRVRELTEESLYSRFMSSIKESIFGGKLTYLEWTAALKDKGQNIYNMLPADIRNSIDQGYEALCRTLGVAENNPGGIYVKMINILGLLSASDRVVYDRYDLDLQSLLDSKAPNRVTYNVSGYSSALTGGDVENHATTYKVSYRKSGDSFTVTNTAIQIVDMFKHWIPLGVEDEEMPDSAWLVLMSKPGVNDFENAKSMASTAGYDISGLANLELPVINPLEGGSGPFNVLGELVLDTDLSWVDTALGMPKIGVVKVDEADGWKNTIVDKKYDCGIPKEYRGAELSGEILRQIIKYLTDGAVDIPISYNFFSNYVTTGTKAYPELRWMSLDDFDMTEVIAKGKTVTQEDLDNFKPADLVFDKANLMTHIINVKFKLEPDEPEDIEYPDSNILNGCKIWDGDEANRPEWLKIHVKEGANEIEGSPITLYKNDFVGKNLWTWTLTLDDSVDKHALTVTEEYPSDYEYSNSYTPTVLGAMIANTWTPDAPPVPVTGRYRFTHIDRYGDERTKTVEVTLKEEEINGYSGNNYQPGVPTYIWTAEAQELFGKNPLLTAALAVTGNTDYDQKDVSVYKNDVEWDLIKLSADEATNMTPDSEERTLTVLAKTKPYTFTFNYYFVKDGSTQYRGTLTDIEYGKPVTFNPNYSDPEKYAYIEDTIPSDEFCYWSADEAGLIPITTNRTFGMLLRGKWHDDGDSERAVSVYAQYNNNLTEDWVPLIEETTFTHMIDDDNDWVYLDYMTNYVSKDGKVVQDMVAEGDENIRYGLIAVKRPTDSQAPDRDQMIGITQMMIGEDKASAYVGDDDSMVAYRFEYGKQEDTVKPISNFNRVLYTLRSDTEKAENRSFSVIAYITVDGQNYYYSEVNNDIDVHELLNQ